MIAEFLHERKQCSQHFSQVPAVTHSDLFGQKQKFPRYYLLFHLKLPQLTLELIEVEIWLYGFA